MAQHRALADLQGCLTRYAGDQVIVRTEPGDLLQRDRYPKALRIALRVWPPHQHRGNANANLAVVCQRCHMHHASPEHQQQWPNSPTGKAAIEAIKQCL